MAPLLYIELTHEVCHRKTDLKVFVVVIPKEGVAGQSFFWYDTDYKV